MFHHRSQSADQNIGARDRHYYASKMTYAARTLGTPLATLLRAEHVVLFGVEALWQSFRGNRAGARRYVALVRNLLASTVRVTGITQA